jgi:uncharacterized repeat protein (TIGR01451 family)
MKEHLMRNHKQMFTNGGWDFPITLATNTPNDGSEMVLLPSIYTTEARVKVEAVDNIFFDVSNTNFTVLPLTPIISGAGSRLVAESCSPANGAVDPGETVTVSFALQNIGLVASENLIASLIPTDDVLFPSGPETIGSLSPQARSTNSFSFISHARLACGETLTALIEVADGSNFLGRVEFPLSLGRTTFTTNRFANTNRITIADVGPGSPYPSSIDVSGLAGEVAAVRVTLSNMNHSAWGEVDVLLAGPEGQTVLLLSETGAYGNYSGITLTFDDAAMSPLPELGFVTSGVFKPSNYFNDEVFPPPAADGPYGAKLSVFRNTDPNGTWQLFVVDDWEAQDTGSINGGWSLQIVTAQNDCCQGMPPLNDLSLSMLDSPNPIDVGEVLTYTLTVSNSGPLSASQVVVTNFLPLTLTNILINASQGVCSNRSGIVVCEIGALAGGASALITISGQPTAEGAITNRATVTRAGTDGSLTNNTAYVVTFVQEILITVQDATVFEGDSGGKNLSFTARLSGAVLAPVSVDYATADGTALAGSDYIATNDWCRCPGHCSRARRT